VIARRPDAAGVRMAGRLPGDPWRQTSTTAKRRMRVTSSVHRLPRGSYVPPRSGYLGSEPCTAGILAQVSSWGLSAVPAAGARPSAYRYEALTCFANASTDELWHRVILPWGTSIAPLSPISDRFGSSRDLWGRRRRDEVRDTRPRPISIRLISNRPNPDTSTNLSLNIHIRETSETANMSMIPHDSGGSIKTTLTSGLNRA
jgi:hypothetical protein